MGYPCQQRDGVFLHHVIAGPDQPWQQRCLQRHLVHWCRGPPKLLLGVNLLHSDQANSRRATSTKAVELGAMGLGMQHYWPGVPTAGIRLCVLPARRSGHPINDELGLRVVWWS